MGQEDTRQRSDRIRREVRDLTDKGLSPQEILQLFYMRGKWRSRLSEETEPDNSPSEVARD